MPLSLFIPLGLAAAAIGVIMVAFSKRKTLAKIVVGAGLAVSLLAFIASLMALFSPM